MSVDLAFELWSELKRYINNIDRSEAADTLVNLLIDNDYDIEEIRQGFKGDSDIKKSLQSYLNDSDDDLEEEETEDPEDYY
jgi:hypothetical protein